MSSAFQLFLEKIAQLFYAKVKDESLQYTVIQKTMASGQENSTVPRTQERESEWPSTNIAIPRGPEPLCN